MIRAAEKTLVDSGKLTGLSSHSFLVPDLVLLEDLVGLCLGGRVGIRLIQKGLDTKENLF